MHSCNFCVSYLIVFCKCCLYGPHLLYLPITSCRVQWLKCNGMQGNAVPPPPIYGSKRSPNSDCYNARKRHTTIVRGPNLNVAFTHLNFCTLITGRVYTVGKNGATFFRAVNHLTTDCSQKWLDSQALLKVDELLV